MAFLIRQVPPMQRNSPQNYAPTLRRLVELLSNRRPNMGYAMMMPGSSP
jgi:hypothetical protein